MIIKRMKFHKCDYQKFLNGKYNFVSSFEIIKDGDYTTSIELECSNISKLKLLKKNTIFYF